MFRFTPQALSVAALAAAVAFPCASALAQQAKVIPTSATNAWGGAASFYPFVHDVVHAQQVWNGPNVTSGVAVLKEVAFRRDNGRGAYSSIKLANHRMSLGHTSVSPLTMSRTFTANITSTMTVLVNTFTSTTLFYTLPAQAAPGRNPSPFNIKYPISTPYLYNPKNGHLIMEWITGSGQAQSKGGQQLDAVRITKGGGGGTRAFGTWGKFAGGDTVGWKADATKLKPGGAVDITLAGFKQGYTSRMFFGVSDKTYNGTPLPYDLGNIGAPGNFLYTGLNLILPFKLNETSPGSGIFVGAVNIPLPNNSKLIGAKGFVQTYYADAKANAAGLVSSNAMELSIGGASPVTQMLGQSNTTSATGFFLFASSIVNPTGFGGPVVQLTGAIQ